jgi:hypothetical protein
MSTPPIVFTAQAKQLNDKFYLTLNEIIKTYPIAQLKPTINSQYDRSKTNKSFYDANMNKMLALQNEYFIFKNTVVSSTEKIEKEITETDKKITVLENQNKVLKIQLDNLKSSSHSAEGLFDDAQITRNELLFSNFLLFGVMCGGGFMYYKSIKH